MKIYTKKGDSGDTGLLGGSRVRKTHGRIETYGTLDELNSVIGVALAHGADASLRAPLAAVQSDLFQLGAELATPSDRPLAFLAIGEMETLALESAIDEWERELAPLKSFILPGGTPFGAQIQLARTVCRRAERCAVALAESETIRPEVVRYLNRLSDFLFVLGRRANQLAGVVDAPWVART